MLSLPKAVRRLTPDRLRDDRRLRALAVGAGVIPPRVLHSPAEAEVIARLARDASTAVEIGVYEGASAAVLCGALPRGAELHLIDPFVDATGHALPPGWGATEAASRRVVERARRDGSPKIHWHVAPSGEVGRAWRTPIDLVFIDGDHSEEGCRLDWELFHPHVTAGGVVAFHDARLSQPGGDGAPGPTAVVDSLFRGDGAVDGWEIVDETHRLVTVRATG
ncbi:class I SAM-dependent methyltransferase [Conexibacter arvalis]|uniref:Putative O-methyltransferase YrrM n=1 Tax=Conexibacter arvalis TaxID=912552 RepID=A0A840I812_9ACTN|nr:class I SAM-dependent methyltransferase [Conexibacter arvalis]MBB4661039.1 putative O-methyltransferase YrrM [Conexibacter arvalis]